jgi:hypothetical protein
MLLKQKMVWIEPETSCCISLASFRAHMKEYEESRMEWSDDGGFYWLSGFRMSFCPFCGKTIHEEE